jgi:hypothetical protein
LVYKYGYLVYFSQFLYVVHIKIWQPWFLLYERGVIGSSTQCDQIPEAISTPAIISGAGKPTQMAKIARPHGPRQGDQMNVYKNYPKLLPNHFFHTSLTH